MRDVAREWSRAARAHDPQFTVNPTAVIRTLALTLALALGAQHAAAQIGRVGRYQSAPGAWVSLSIGLVQMPTIDDYKTGTSWNFGTVAPWRATIEKSLSQGGSIGLAGAISRPGLAFSGQGGVTDAKANLFQVLGLFRIGGGTGFHQVIEIQGGVTGFSNFRQSSTQSRLLAKDETVLDPTLSIGYGFGYSLSRASEIAIVQDYGLLLHRSDNAPAGADRTHRWSQTRIGIRYGL